MPTAYEKLSALLKELFQLDQADLDFGIYRIMNQKRDEITRFLDHELLPQVKTAFEQYRPADKKVLEDKIAQAKQAAIAAGYSPAEAEQAPRVRELQAEQAKYSVDTDALENEVYSHLYSFFRRYYDQGDFISMRRYKEGVYAIPYEGEEVKLHWANADQYYVKTAENFRDYAFRLPSGKLGHFKIVEAETDKDNVKAPEEKDRRFILAEENAVQAEGEALVMRFEYRVDADKRDQKTLNALAAAAILAGVPAEWAAELRAASPTESNPKRTLLEKHLADYSARNTFDYFIHKDLRGFLNRELDFYIKNEIIRLDDIENQDAPHVEQYLSLVKVVRGIAHKIIAFLAQIEDFQKKLWLKKKFVVETHYCITLDRVPEKLYPEICANAAQREEWARLFAIDEIKGDLVSPGYSTPLSMDFLKANPYLLVDTKFFAQSFIDSLLMLENIDEQVNGLLVHSENFQALNLLIARYKKDIKCVYIDPPYNSPSSEILYKNDYKHSSWLSLLNDRLFLSYHLLTDDGTTIVAIDKYEHNGLYYVLKQMQPENDIVSVSIEHNKKGTQGDHFSFSNEFAVFSISPNLRNLNLIELPQDEWEYSNLRNWGSESLRTDAKNCFYSIIVKGNEIIGFGDVCEDDFHPSSANVKQEDGTIHVYPIDSDGIERKWRYARNTVTSILPLLRIDYARNGEMQISKAKPDEQYKTMWYSSLYNAGDFGTKIIGSMGFGKDNFKYPKSLYTVKDCINTTIGKSDLIIDYFAGSGTTGHAVIDLNRDDKGDGFRKYILIEMGNYFETVTKPRIEKTIYSKDWKDGKPASREGISHCFKYLRLESYEDALNNLTLQRTQEQQLALEASPEFKENYLLSYMLDVESRGALLNTQSFVHPFDYRLNIATGAVGESQPTRVDLVETFNYLIGLHVETLQSLRGFRVVTGKTPAGERALIIWRDLEEKSGADLEEFFRKQDYNPRDMEFDLIYVNGDNNLENIRRPDETWKVRLIEEDFLRLMWEE